MQTVFISIGSNIGKKITNCIKAIEEVSNFNNTQIVKKSKFYETEPLENREQDNFINCVIKIKTVLKPFELLSKLQEAEKKLGREKTKKRYTKRIIDLDIIFYNNDIIKLPNLEIPHPKAHKRVFVLKPICDINKNFIHPVIKKKVKEILKNLEYQKCDKI